METDFLRVLRFPLPILIPPTAPHSSIIRGWYNRPNSGRRTKWTQSHHTPRNKKNKKRVVNVVFQVLTGITMESTIFWDVTPCSFGSSPTILRNILPSEVSTRQEASSHGVTNQKIVLFEVGNVLHLFSTFGQWMSTTSTQG
jgi:hypothetical protein